MFIDWEESYTRKRQLSLFRRLHLGDNDIDDDYVDNDNDDDDYHGNNTIPEPFATILGL